MGWRAIRMGLDRPALLRTQMRALLRAAGRARAAHHDPDGVDGARDGRGARARREGARDRRGKGYDAPKRVAIGAMIEVPCLLFELDALMKKVDFVSVGSNDLMQFMFAADRTNARVGSRYDRVVAGAAQGAEGARQGSEEARGAAHPVRGDGGTSDRGDGADRAGIPIAVDGAGLDRPGQGHDPGAACRPRRKAARRAAQKEHEQHPWGARCLRKGGRSSSV